MNIRTRIILFFVPVLIAAILVTGMISFFTSRSGITRISMKLMAFKAEELRKYIESQWQLLLQYQFLDDPEFVDASRLAIQAFAQSLIRSDTELIAVFDSQAEPVVSTSPVELTEEDRRNIGDLYGEQMNGWIELGMQGRHRIGHAFFFEPFDWLCLLSEDSGVFYTEVRQMTIQTVIVLSVAMSISLVLLLLFSKYLTRPVYSIYRAMEDVISSKTLSKRVVVEYPDEIGGLAHQFNTMISELEDAYDHVKSLAVREASARKGLAQREIETLTVLGKAAEYRDPETGAHILRVGHYSRMLAKALEQSEHDQDLIYYASPLHDIGKLGIPDSILLKPGKLTSEEFELIKNHTLIAGDILRDAKSPYLQAGAIIALTHHECFDGSGYPRGLVGEEIPLFGRIVGLVDVFDALTSNRPYKKAWSVERALGLLDDERGKHFDPRIVELFLAREDEVRRTYEAHPDG